MNFDNPFSTFLGKKNVVSTGLKRARSEEKDVSLLSAKETISPTSVRTASTTRVVEGAASATASPNAAEPGCTGNTHTTGGTFSSSAKVALLSDDRDEEEEEELRLLLGGMNKASVLPQAVTRVPSHVSSVAVINSSNGGASNKNSTVSSAAVLMRELPWATRSSDVLAEIKERFEVQFRWELRRNADLMRVFEPFFSDRAINRIHGERQGNQFLPASAVTIEGTGSTNGFTLRPYQLEGVQFLLNNFHKGTSCILADDMGLGKTAQISAFLHMLKTQDFIDGPHVIVAPLSTLTGWTRELARWAPELRVVKYHGEKRGRLLLRTAKNNRHSVFVTTPAVFSQDRGFFRKRAWVVAVFDEAHILKSDNTMISYIARKLTACFRLAVTGTPVQNNVGEVWSIMNFLYPSYCAGYDGGDNKDEEDAMAAAEDCAKVLQYIMLRRTKGSIELGIPPRVDEPILRIAPTYVQQKLLSRITEEALNGENANERGLQLHLSHERIVCCHPLALRLLAAENRASGQTSWEDRLSFAGIELNEASIIMLSAKMIELDRMLRELKANGHRCLIFSNFTSVLDLLQALCVLRGYSFERLDGSTQRVERELSMIRFNAPRSSCFVFLLTTTAGGVGVTLTGADTVILFDAHFNPQIDRQAADRAHRIGQTRVVRVFRLCLKETIEERILNVALRKASLGDFILEGGSCKGDDSSSGVALSAHHIRLLFGYENQMMVPTDNKQPSIRHVDVDCANTSEADNMVEELLRIEREGLSRACVTKKDNHQGISSTKKLLHNCFVCGEIMRPLEPLYHCFVCPKAYHADCVGERKPKVGMSGPRHWTCPRHSCASCGKAQNVDGAVFMCTECPLSFCFDCLDPRYFDLDDTGAEFVHIRRDYAGMEGEGMNTRRSIYYITCLRCCGVLSSSSSSSEAGSYTASDSDEDDDDDDDALVVVE